MKSDIATARRVLAQEVEALQLLSESLDEQFERAVDHCFGAHGRIVCAGVGKSGHVARKIAATLASTGSPAQFVHPTEASHGDLGMITRDDVVLALSRSGETGELSDMIHYTRRFSIPLLSMTAVAGSTLGKAGDVRLLVPDVPEACTQTSAPTTSTTLMMAMGDALAVALLERRGFRADDFRVFHPGGKLGAMLKTVGDIMHGGDALPLIAEGASLADALHVLSEKGFGCVGVTDAAGRLTGMLTDGDVRRLVTSGRTAKTVDEAMSRGPVTMTPDMLASRALNILNERKFTQAFVAQCDKPVGVLHMHDILRIGVG